jgi:hypothetical protein
MNRIMLKKPRRKLGDELNEKWSASQQYIYKEEDEDDDNYDEDNQEDGEDETE